MDLAWPRRNKRQTPWDRRRPPTGCVSPRGQGGRRDAYARLILGSAKERVDEVRLVPTSVHSVGRTQLGSPVAARRCGAPSFAPSWRRLERALRDPLVTLGQASGARLMHRRDLRPCAHPSDALKAPPVLGTPARKCGKYRSRGHPAGFLSHSSRPLRINGRPTPLRTAA